MRCVQTIHSALFVLTQCKSQEDKSARLAGKLVCALNICLVTSPLMWSRYKAPLC